MSGSGFQNTVSLTQYASRFTRSANPNAWNISIVRQAMPSACPSCNGPGLASTTHTESSGNAASCAAKVSPVGPDPTTRTSTSTRQRARRRSRRQRLDRIGDRRIAGPEPVQMELHPSLPTSPVAQADTRWHDAVDATASGAQMVAHEPVTAQFNVRARLRARPNRVPEITRWMICQGSSVVFRSRNIKVGTLRSEQWA